MKCPFKLADSGLHKDLLVNGAAQNDEYLQYIVSSLKAVKKETWVADLADKRVGIALVAELARHSDNFNLDDAYLDALAGYGEVLLDENRPILGPVTSLETTLAGLSTSDQRMLRLRLRDSLEKAEVYGLAFFQFFGQVLLDQEFLLEDIRIVRTIFSRMVESAESGPLRWLCSAFKAQPDLLRQCSKAERDDFRDRVIARENDEKGNSEVLEALDEIKKLC